MPLRLPAMVIVGNGLDLYFGANGVLDTHMCVARETLSKLETAGYWTLGSKKS
jgi:hypothetical protein